MQKAFSDLRMAIFQQQEAANVAKSSQVSMDSLARSTELAFYQYEIGHIDQINFLDAERQLFDAGINLISAQRDQLSAIVYFCMALGGGWTEDGQGQNQNDIAADTLDKE